MATFTAWAFWEQIKLLWQKSTHRSKATKSPGWGVYRTSLFSSIWHLGMLTQAERKIMVNKKLIYLKKCQRIHSFLCLAVCCRRNRHNTQPGAKRKPQTLAMSAGLSYVPQPDQSLGLNCSSFPSPVSSNFRRTALLCKTQQQQQGKMGCKVQCALQGVLMLPHGQLAAMIQPKYIHHLCKGTSQQNT